MTDYRLSKGAHASANDGRCAMEWVAYIAGEPHSDHPVCVSVELRQFAIKINDHMPDDVRQRLRPYLARMIGTAGDGHSDRRLFRLVDLAVREWTPAALELRGHAERAAKLRALDPIVDRASARKAYAYAAYAADAAAAYAAYAAAAAAAAADAAGKPAPPPAWEHVFRALDELLPSELIDLPEPVEARAREIGALTR